MAIGSVVTRGYGPGASIALVVTRGYSQEAQSQGAGTGAGAFTPAEIAAHKLRQRRFLASLPAAKLSPDEALLLVRLMQEMRNLQTLPPAGREPEIAEKLEAAVAEKLERAEPGPAPKGARGAQPFVPAAAPEATGFAREIEEMRATIARLIAAREEAEEDDLEALLLLAA